MNKMDVVRQAWSEIQRRVFGPGFIRLRQNTLWLAAGMNGKVNRAEARQSEGGLAPAEFR